MKWLRTGIVRLRSLFRREQMDRELDAELASHLEMHVADNLRGGMTPEAARRDALIKRGGVEQTKESYRDRRDVVWLENLGGDLRFGIRSMARNRGLSLVAIFALALGIGATTVMFSVVQNVFFNALPYKNFNRLVVIKVQNLANAGGWKGRDFFTPEELAAFRAQNHVFEE